MNKRSRKTLGRIKTNDSILTILQVGRDDPGAGVFNASSTNEFSKLGTAIAANQHQKRYSFIFIIFEILH